MKRDRSEPIIYSFIIFTLFTVAALALVAMMILTGGSRSEIAFAAGAPSIMAFTLICGIWLMHFRGYDIPIRSGPPDKKKQQ